MAKQNIRFIINPYSGVREKYQLNTLIPKYLEHQKYDYDIEFTQYAGHATVLAKDAVDKGYHIVVAVGGDGSVKEVATALVGTNTVLGILPLGSGNGFAKHLGLGRGAEYALEVINDGASAVIDTCTVNDEPFVNLVGFGFDGLVAKELKGSKVRGLIGYTRSTIQHIFRYKSANYKITIDDGKPMTRKAYMLNIVNGTTYGYNFQFYANAKLNDGIIHVLIVKDTARWRYFWLLFLSLRGKMHKSKIVESYDAKRVKVETKADTLMQMDGESFKGENPFDIRVLPNTLRVIVPKQSEYLR